MKAVVWTAYGPPEVLEVRQVEEPIPGDHDILVKVRASSVTAGDVELRRSTSMGALVVPLRLFLGVFRPRGTRIPGQELAGDVVAVGSEVTDFQVGDRVCGHSGFRFGGNAEYATLPQSGMVARIPDGVSYEEATTLPTAGLYGLYFSRQADIRPGQTVLVNGGAGSIGSYAIQMALAAGARVTAVDRGDKGEFLTDLGVDEVIDYRTRDFATNVDVYDAILDVIDKSSFPVAATSLKPGGIYLHSDISPLAALRRRLFRASGGRRSEFVAGREDADDLEYLLAKVSAGEIRSVIDHTFRLDDIVEAHRYAESGDKRGHVVVTVA
ncbi:MAG TPA: NAD(P)-dependent alcohol dehydrogenase [Acidimicrobiia bacterium]